MTTTAQQTALEQPVARTAYFLELFFAAGVFRVCSYGQTFTWGGYDWLGLGAIGRISPVQESAGVASSAMMFTLNIAQTALLGMAMGAVENYRGLPAKLYFCPLDAGGALIGTPELCWRGIMDTVAAGIEGEEGQITLKCETSAYGLKRTPSQRLNAAQHKLNYPTDTGFDYLTDLIANPTLWLSKKFQQI